MIKLHECRACSSTEFKKGPTAKFKTCLHCGGVFGHGSPEEIAKVITLEFCTPEEERESGDFGLRFFDIEIVGTDTSCHGWFNPRTKKVHQFG